MKEGRRHRRSWEQLWRDELAERCSQFGESQMKVALDPEAENPARLAALEFLSVTPVPPIRLARSLADLLSPSVSAMFNWRLSMQSQCLVATGLRTFCSLAGSHTVRALERR